ncbi:MAG: hypothetical protein Q7U54_10435 [Bacteroidales bacterium]|nr:hypothetical protein [Bacteroidales bacterium]
MINLTARANKIFLSVWFSCWLMFSLTNSAYSETNISFPKSPIAPTYEQCTILGQQYQLILQGLHEQMSSCMNQNPPTIGRYQNCAGKQAMTAWVQCSDIDVEQCKVEAITQKELENCRAKAHGPSDRDTDMATTLKKANSTYEHVRDMVQLIQNPESFLRKNLTHYPNAITQLFGSSGSKFDVDLAQEVYRYSYNEAKDAVQLTPNSIIRRIQQTALQHIANIHKNMIWKMRQLSEDMNNFKIVKPDSHGDSTFERKHKPDEDLCQILQTC